MILMVGVSATHLKHSHVYFIRLILIMLWDKGEREKESRVVRWWTISIAGKCFWKCLSDEWPWSLLLYDYGTFLSSTNQSLIVIFHITVALYRTILIITNNNNNKGFSALFFIIRWLFSSVAYLRYIILMENMLTRSSHFHWKSDRLKCVASLIRLKLAHFPSTLLVCDQVLWFDSVVGLWYAYRTLITHTYLGITIN